MSGSFTGLRPVIVSTVAATGFALGVGPKVPATVATVDDFLRDLTEHATQPQFVRAAA